MDQKCGNCANYKGAKINCGQSKYMTPQSDTDTCLGRHFVEKTKSLGSQLQRYIDKYPEFGIVDARDHLAFSQKIDIGKYPDLGLGQKIDVETAGFSGFKKLYYASPSKLKKENNMSNAIIRLADSQLSKQIEDFGGLQLDIREALEEMQKEEQKTVALQAAKEVMRVLNAANNHIESNVLTMREARKTEQRAKEKIVAINKAKAYGKATNNFVPLSVLLGLVAEYQVENKDLLKIDESKLPEGWDKKGS